MSGFISFAESRRNKRLSAQRPFALPTCPADASQEALKNTEVSAELSPYPKKNPLDYMENSNDSES